MLTPRIYLFVLLLVWLSYVKRSLTQLLLTGLLYWRDESVGRHLDRYVDSDYIGDLDNLCSTTKLEVDLR